MSRRECASILLDTSKCMGEVCPHDEEKRKYIEMALDCIGLMCEHKLLYTTRSHEVGVSKFGQAVECLEESRNVDVEFVRGVAGLREGLDLSSEDNGDTFAAISNACTRFAKRHGKKGPSHRIVVFTSLRGASSMDQKKVEELAGVLTETGARLQVVLCSEESSATAHSKNRRMMETLLAGSQASCETVWRNAEVLEWMKEKSQTNITKYRGTLELSASLKISVCSYSKSTMDQMTSLKKFSRLSSDSMCEVRTERVHYEHDDASMTGVAKDRIMKAYYYGRQIVPVSTEKIKEMKVADDRQLRLLCFSDEKKVPRHFMLAGVDIIVGQAAIEANLLCFNALVDGLVETGKIGIARHVGRANSNPKLVGLFPKKEENGLRCLYMCQLPTAEEIRDFRFVGLPQASEDQRDGVQRMVECMDLCASDLERLNPEETQNPILRVFNENLVARGVWGRADLVGPSTLDLGLGIGILPNQGLVEEMAKQLESLFGFQIHDIKTATQRARVFWHQLIRDQRERERERVSVGEMEGLQKVKRGDERNGDDHLKEISMIHPVTDFNEMRKNKKVDLAEEAVKKMAGVIDRLVDESIRGSHYEKALECLEELRMGAIEEDESEFFNEFLRRMRNRLRSGPHQGFWRSVMRRGVSLISNAENATSRVEEEESREFLKEEEREMNEQMETEPLPDNELDEIE